MGEIIEITEHISVECRRESVVLHVDGRDDQWAEYRYADLDTIIKALQDVTQHTRFQLWARKEGGHG